MCVRGVREGDGGEKVYAYVFMSLLELPSVTEQVPA